MTDARRPTAVTMACLFLGLNSALTLVDICVVLSDWGSREMREAMAKALREMEKALAGTPLAADFTVDQVLAISQLIYYGAIPVAVTGMVLSVYAARRDNAARIILTVMAAGAAVLMAMLGLAGLLAAVLYAVCAGALWSASARAWYRPAPTRS